MRVRNMICVSVAFLVFGIIILIIGVIMLVASTGYESHDSAGSTVLGICGRVACICGGLLILVTLCTCVYLCMSGTPRGAESGDVTMGSQTERVRCRGTRRRLRDTTTTTTASGKASTVTWSADVKPPASSMLSKPPTSGRRYAPGGDTTDGERESKLSQRYFTNAHNSLSIGTGAKASKNSNFPHLSNRRRRHSVDRLGVPFNQIPPLPSFTSTSICSSTYGDSSSNRLWEPTLQLAGQGSTFQASGSRLLGDTDLEPLGSMLHLGGQAKLGLGRF